MFVLGFAQSVTDSAVGSLQLVAQSIPSFLPMVSCSRYSEDWSPDCDGWATLDD